MHFCTTNILGVGADEKVCFVSFTLTIPAVEDEEVLLDFTSEEEQSEGSVEESPKKRRR